MIVTVHESTATDFTTLGLGALIPTECTVEEKAGGLYELTVVQPIMKDNRHTLLTHGRIIKAMAPVRETPLIEFSSTGTVEREIYAAHASNGARLNMRTGPSLDSKVIHAYRQGTEVVKLSVSEDGEWFQVAVLEGGATGWMWAEYLDYVRTETETIIGDTPGGVVQPRQTREQLFRIYEVEPDSRLRTVTARAQHISYDLKGAVIVGEYSPEGVAANQACWELMNRLDHDMSDFHVYCAVTEPVTGRYGGSNLINCLLDPETGIAAQTGARVIRDNFDIFILPDEERNRGVELRYGKNLLAAALITNTSGIVTRIQPVGKNKDGDPLYITENNGFVDSAHINEYPVIYAKSVQYDVAVGDELNEEQARALLKEKAEADFEAGCDLASVRLDADFVRLDVTEEYKKVANSYALHLYDKVPIIDREAGIVVSVRMVAYKYDCLPDRYAATTLGDIGEAEVTVYGYEIGGGIQGGKIAINSLSGDRLRSLSVGYGKFDVAAIRQLSADAIQAVRADIHQLVAGEITTDELYADLAKIAVAQITAANIDKANIQWAQIESLTAAIAEIASAEIGTADIDYAKIKDLVTGTAIITEGVGGKLYINRLAVTEANMVSLTVGELMLKASDGSFVRLVADGSGGVTTETVQVEGDNIANSTIEGGKLIENAITARELNVAQIFADEALIRAIKAANIDVADLFAANATIAALDAYIIKASTIEAIQNSLSLWADDKISLAVGDKLDADAPSVGVNTGTGGGVEVKITKDEFNVDVPGEDGDFRLNADGGFLPVLQAQSVIAPNVAPMYDGPKNLFIDPTWSASYIENGMLEPGDCLMSLKDALALLSYKTVPYAVTIYLGDGITEYGNATLSGCIASHGITIRTASTSADSYATLHGKLEIRYSLGIFYVQHMRINPPAGDGSHAIHACGNGVLVSPKYCIIRGTGSSSGSYGMCADDGAKIFATDSEIYDCDCSLVSRWMGEMCSWNNKGNCAPYIENATARFFGTAPCSDTSFWYYWYGACDVHQNNVTVDQGSASGTVSPTITTGTYLATSTGSYAGSGSRFRSEVGQGWYSGIGRIRGCMWFNASSISGLSGRTILSATLRLSMRKGVGRGASVTVELCGTVASSGASSAAVTKSYGVIGTTSPGEVTTITIPNQAVTDMVGGTINGLMLYSSDTGAYKDRSYSKNYALFDGADAEESVKPMLTVVYR